MLTQKQAEKLFRSIPESILLIGNIDENTVMVDGSFLDLESSLKVRNHSSTGFSWGFSGSGPSQFALALLLKYLPENVALEYYQPLKMAYIAYLPQCTFRLGVNLRKIMIEIATK